MLLDGSLQEVVSILSKALYGEPMVGLPTVCITARGYCSYPFPLGATSLSSTKLKLAIFVSYSCIQNLHSEA